MNPISIDLFDTGIHLRAGGNVTAGPRVMDAGTGGWQVAAYHLENNADAHADHWEIHPEAEELVAVLAGSCQLYFRPQSPGEAETAIALSAGHAVIVPRGRWHRLELDGPTDTMSITLRDGSRLEKR
ncbi:cupin domain-containing protein [Cryptosporangium sp. NPDC048952]|uniref:cupin domain-containing protein n=1 Tax=Cryptosporangium sp. NPDC048952 TaxID=3363961 RepID=UPI00371153B7